MSCREKTGCCQEKSTSEMQDYLVCTCMGVMKLEILEAIESGINTFEALAENLGVGTGCTTCVEEVMQMLAKSRKKCCKS